MTFIPEKKDALYVRGVVIACGLEDSQGDKAPDKEGIKKIFTNYLKQGSDVQHSYISNFNVHQLENTITTAPMQINGQEVPVGSWIASHMVLNPSIVAMIREGRLTGYSLGAIGDKSLNENISLDNTLLSKSDLLMYESLKDYDELNPLFISFVKKASNGFTWEVMNYNQFLSKSNLNDRDITGDMMTDVEQKEEMVKVSVVERLLGPLLNKAETEIKSGTEDVKDEVKVEEKTEEVETGISNDEIMAKLESIEKQSSPESIANAVVDAIKQLATETVQQKQEAEVLAKAEEEEIKEEEEEVEEEVEEPSKLEKSDKETNEETPKLEKSSNKLDEMESNKKVTPKRTFLDNEKRDEYGRVKRYL